MSQYKHILKFRHKTSSGLKSEKLEIITSEQDRIWYGGDFKKRTLNLVFINTGISISDIYNQEVTLETNGGVFIQSMKSEPINRNTQPEDLTSLPLNSTSSPKRKTVYDNSTSTPKRKTVYDQCYHCENDYKRGSGVYSHLRDKAGKTRRYDYCSNQCGQLHRIANGFTWVNENGLTDEENARLQEKRRQKRAQQAAQERERALQKKKKALADIKSFKENPENMYRLGVSAAISIINDFYLDGYLNEREYVNLYGKLKRKIPFFSSQKYPEPIFNQDRYREKFVDALDEKFLKDLSGSVKKNWLIYLVVVTVLAGGGYFGWSYYQTVKNDAKELSRKLEGIEDEIIMSINDGYESNAQELIQQLEHPSTLKMEEAEFDVWDGYPTYRDYWSEKKHHYQSLVRPYTEHELEGENYSRKENKDNSTATQKEKSNLKKSFELEEPKLETEIKKEKIKQHPYQDLLDEGYTEEDIQMMIEEGYIESRSVLK